MYGVLILVVEVDKSGRWLVGGRVLVGHVREHVLGFLVVGWWMIGAFVFNGGEMKI